MATGPLRRWSVRQDAQGMLRCMQSFGETLRVVEHDVAPRQVVLVECALRLAEVTALEHADESVPCFRVPVKQHE
jgi:hypothetical protein